MEAAKYVSELVEKARVAQAVIENYTQEQVDRIFLAACTAANQARIPLARMAVEETGMGVVEDKVIKNHYASEYIYNAYKDTTPFLFPTKESIRRCFKGKKAK